MKLTLILFSKNCSDINYGKRPVKKPNTFYFLCSLLVLFSGSMELYSQTSDQLTNVVTLDRGADDCSDFICGDNNDKVLVCHLPPGNPDNAHEICISPNALETHLTHGDYCGPCEILSNGTPENLKSISIYPNPFTNILFVELNEDLLIHNENLEIIIYDILGRSIRRVTNIKTVQLEIDLSELHNGMFIYTIGSEREIIGTGKILKH